MEESYNGHRTIDVSKLNFQYSYMDIDAAAQDKIKEKEKISIKKKVLTIYPDTTVWIRDFQLLLQRADAQ